MSGTQMELLDALPMEVVFWAKRNCGAPLFQVDVGNLVSTPQGSGLNANAGGGGGGGGGAAVLVLVLPVMVLLPWWCCLWSCCNGGVLYNLGNSRLVFLYSCFKAVHSYISGDHCWGLITCPMIVDACIHINSGNLSHCYMVFDIIQRTPLRNNTPLCKIILCNDALYAIAICSNICAHAMQSST